MPSSVEPEDESESDFRYLPANLGVTEDLEKYIKGGLHPTHLGDVFDARYKVVHKLGAGGFSTVWLARDEAEQRWVALKIITAEHTTIVEQKSSNLEHAPTLAGLRRFHVEGPNGRHLCLVLPVLGPSGSELSQGFACRLRPTVARQASRQAVEAIAKLHSQGYCHGDATTANFCFGLDSLDRYSEKNIYDLFGEPETAPVETTSGEIPGSEAPRSIVKTLDFLSSSQNLIQTKISLIDIDQSFPASNPPHEMLGTPLECTAPEVALGLSAGPASDVWALGCSIFRLRSGDGLYSGFEVDSPANLLTLIQKSLGDLPERWQETLFDDDGQPTEDASQGEPLEASEGERHIRDIIDQIYDEPKDLESLMPDLTSCTTDFVDDQAKPFPTCFTDLVWKPAATKVGSVHLRSYDDDVTAALEKVPKIDKNEADLLYDLLKKIFVYDPEQRITAEQMLAHPWFLYGSGTRITGKRKRDDIDEAMSPIPPAGVSPEEN